jgi:hypothetical protein
MVRLRRQGWRGSEHQGYQVGDPPCLGSDTWSDDELCYHGCGVDPFRRVSRRDIHRYHRKHSVAGVIWSARTALAYDVLVVHSL